MTGARAATLDSVILMVMGAGLAPVVLAVLLRRPATPTLENACAKATSKVWETRIFLDE